MERIKMLVYDYNDAERTDFQRENEKPNQWGTTTRGFYVRQVIEKMDYFISQKLNDYGAKYELADQIRDLPQLPNMSWLLCAAILIKIFEQGPKFRDLSLKEAMEKRDKLLTPAFITETNNVVSGLNKQNNEKEAKMGVKIDLFRYYTAIVSFIKSQG